MMDWLVGILFVLFIGVLLYGGIDTMRSTRR